MDVKNFSCDKPIFVIGTPRSGTTLTAKILGSHSSIFMPGETHYFSDIYSRQKEIGDLCEQKSRARLWEKLINLYAKFNEPADQGRIDRLLKNGEFVRSLRGATCDYGETFKVFMCLQMEFSEKKRWGNNVPKDIFHVSEIRAIFPDAKFILCVRDVRDFLGSYKSKWKATSEENVDRIKKLYHPAVTSYLWKASMRLLPILKKDLGDESLFILPYEKLVADPEVEIKKVCDFLGEMFESEMLNVAFSNSSGVASEKGVYSSSVGAWQSRLSPEECWIAQRVAKKEMIKLGYELKKIKPGQVNLWLLILSAPFALWRGLAANKKNTGPVIPYLFKRLRSLIS